MLRMESCVCLLGCDEGGPNFTPGLAVLGSHVTHALRLFLQVLVA